jgi:hypothetical protein
MSLCSPPPLPLLFIPPRRRTIEPAQLTASDFTFLVCDENFCLHAQAAGGGEAKDKPRPTSPLRDELATGAMFIKFKL